MCPENIKATTLPGKNYGTVYWKEPLVAGKSYSESHKSHFEALLLRLEALFLHLEVLFYVLFYKTFSHSML